MIEVRLRNVKNKEEIMKSAKLLITNPEDNMGKWNSVFGNDNPIYIEIGIGKGNFIIENAIENPNVNYIGIEKYDSVLVKAIKKADEALPNLKFVRMDALDIDKVFHKEVDRIYLNFSDPWPKKRHLNRRLTSKVFLEKYENVFKSGKQICQKTDNKELFEFSIVSLNECGYLIKEISLDLHSSEFFDGITTEYEDRFSSKGNSIYYLKAEK